MVSRAFATNRLGSDQERIQQPGRAAVVKIHTARSGTRARRDALMTSIVRRWFIKPVFIGSALAAAMPAGFAQSPVRDPGVRPVIDWSRIGGWPSNACPSVILRPVPGLTASEQQLFCAGAQEFAKEDKVKEDGLGPTMNLTSCLGCHQYPISGGSSPIGKNPQYDFARSYPAGTNTIPPFVQLNGPVRVARFKRHLDVPGQPDDGGVHALFTITGLEGADGCVLKQEDFQKEIDRKNIITASPR